jgi:alkaline phosphatase D
MPAAFPDGDLDHAVELGAVDTQRVRVWVRCSGAASVEAELCVEGRPPVHATLALGPETDWTGALSLCLEEPAPGAAFTCTVAGRQLRGRLAFAPGSRQRLVFGFGSCNRPFETVAADRIAVSPAAAIYPAMLHDLEQQDADFLLLAGDQVYSDELTPVSVRERLSGDADHPAPLIEAIGAYRRVSRGFLGESGYRRLRERFPTYCIWDDHDIFNCWGSRLTKSPQDQRMFAAASRVYGEYQHTRNPGGALGAPPFNYTFRYGDVGFLVLDIRGCRDYEQGQLLGQEQWERLRAYLASDDAATIQTLFVVSTIPIAHVSRWLAMLFDRLPGNGGNTVRDRWCSAAFVASRDALLDELFSWQTAKPERQVIVLSGDVHCASAFTIRQRRGNGCIQQFTSSALTTPSPLQHRLLNRLAVLWPNAFEPRYRFLRRGLLTFHNNFGRVAVDPLPSGGHRVTLTLQAWLPHRRRLQTAATLVTMPRRSRPLPAVAATADA